MKTIRFSRTSSVAALAATALLATFAACGDDDISDNVEGNVDARVVDDDFDAAPGETQYVQIEQLARPGINEALLLTPAFLAGYNAGAPDFEGFDEATVNAVVAEAKTVLQAFYLGTCLLNGVLGLDATTGLKPAGLECEEVGGNIFQNDDPLTGTMLDAAVATAAGAYADKVVGQFLPDVLRIDTASPSGYLTLCGDATSTPLLCGGRNLEDDVIDITYNYLLNGAATPTSQPQNQVGALTGDGVVFRADGVDRGNTVDGDPDNPSQGHPLTSDTFPYAAAPL